MALESRVCGVTIFPSPRTRWHNPLSLSHYFRFHQTHTHFLVV